MIPLEKQVSSGEMLPEMIFEGALKYVRYINRDLQDTIHIEHEEAEA